MEYYIELANETTRTYFFRIHLVIGSKEYEATAKVTKDLKCKKLIWRGERPSQISKETEKIIKKEAEKSAKEAKGELKVAAE